MSSDLCTSLDAPIPTMAWAKEYGLSKAIIALWDVSLHPKDSSNPEQKLGCGEVQHGGAICEFDVDTNEATLCDGVAKPINTRRSFNPENWVFRAHYPISENKKAATWDVRLVAEHENQSSSRDNHGTILVNQKNKQQWGFLNDVAWIRQLGARVTDPELMFNAAGFLPQIAGGSGSDARGTVATPVARNGGFVTDGKYDGQWAQAGKFIIGPSVKASRPGTTTGGGAGSTQTGIPGLGGPSASGYNQADFSSQIHGSGGGAPGISDPSGGSPYGYQQSTSAPIYGSGGGGPGTSDPSGSSIRGYNQSGSAPIYDGGGGGDRGYQQSQNYGAPPARASSPSGGGSRTASGTETGGASAKGSVGTPHGATSSPESAGPETGRSFGGTTGDSALGGGNQDFSGGAGHQTVVDGGKGPKNPGQTQTDPVDNRQLATEWGMRADCGIDFGKRIIGRFVNEPQGKPQDGGSYDELRRVYLYVDKDKTASPDDKLDTELDDSSNNPKLPKLVEKKPIHGVVKVPKASPHENHYDYSYHGDPPKSSSSSSSGSSTSGTPTAGGSSTPAGTNTDPDDSDPEEQTSDGGVPPSEGGGESNTGSGGATDHSGETTTQTHTDGDGNQWTREVPLNADGTLNGAAASPWTMH